MKSNPFYALSASAMLLGCWLLSEALHLQAGQIGGLLLLMAVLQVYEGLLVGLGAWLVRTGRAPRDGVTVLVLETVFLVDAPLLAAECVTADARVGTWCRRPPGGPGRGQARLGAGAPLRASCRGRRPGCSASRRPSSSRCPCSRPTWRGARAFGPPALYGLWWATLLLPLAQRALLRETGAAAEASRAHAAWTWVPAAMALLHLWAVGYIHAIPLPAGLPRALPPRPRRDRRPRPGGPPGRPAGRRPPRLARAGRLAGLRPSRAGRAFRLAAPSHPVRRGDRVGLPRVARPRAVAGRARGGQRRRGASSARPHRTWRGAWAGCCGFLDSLLPRDAFGWGLLTVIAAFVLLGAGARRSLEERPRARRVP